jgi:hypothetical protein
MSFPLGKGVGDIFLPHLSVGRKGISRRFSSSSAYHITPRLSCQEVFSQMKSFLLLPKKRNLGFRPLQSPIRNWSPVSPLSSIHNPQSAILNR